jgi:UDP-2,3-diacylglucosamine pyrophosphatase LpxH
MSLHDSLLSALQSVASVQLVACLKDERLNFGGDNDLQVFVPDIHLVSKKVRKRYPYGTNDTGVLTQALDAIRQLKQREAAAQKKVSVFQIGDFLDLWRETPVMDDRVDAASRIADDHRALLRAFFAPGFKTRFLLGNHDFELWRWPNFVAWERRYFLGPTGTTKPSGIALHGDVFDEIETFPDTLQRLVVFFLSPFKTATDHELNDVMALVHQENRRHDFTLQVGGDALLGKLAPTTQVIPERYNVGEHKFLSEAMLMCQRANRDYGLSLRFAIIGHTHHARIAVHEQGEEFFALIDTGAWIENCVFPDGTRQPNMQLTALSGNEVRIYQLGRRADV